MLRITAVVHSLHHLKGVTERNGNGNLLLDWELMDHDRDMLHFYRLVLNAGGHGKCTVSGVAERD